MTWDAMLFESLKYFMVACGIILGCCSFKLARKLRKRKFDFNWLIWSLSFFGFYWAGYYLRSILDISINLHQVWVRTPLLLTLGVVTAGIIALLRRIK